MTFRYVQSTGKFYADGILWGIGYAGHGSGKNNPDAQNIPNVGPLPCGTYTIGAVSDSPKTGPLTIILCPSTDNRMFGRSAFRIHGDNKAHDASEGCIILPREVRERIAQQRGDKLEVVAHEDGVQSTSGVVS